MTTAIQANNLTKQYPIDTNWKQLIIPARLSFPAVDMVSLEVKCGEIFGLIGPNGAGKTTLIKLLSTLVLPTSGTATILGLNLFQDDEIRRRTSLVTSDERSFYWRLTGRQNLEFFASLYGLKNEQLVERVNLALDRVDLIGVAEKPFRTYSSGMKQRLAIARGLLNSPQLLFLDEPSRGLDPATSARLHGLILNLSAETGMTVFLTTHQLEEAQKLCQRIAIMDKGKIVNTGTVQDLRRSIESEKIYLIYTGQLSQGQIESASSLDVLMNISQCENADDGREKILQIKHKEGESTLNQVIDHLRKAGIDIMEIIQQRMSLNEIFVHYTDQHPTDRESPAETGLSAVTSAETIMPMRKGLRIPSLFDLGIIFAFLKRDWLQESSYRFSFILQFVGIFFSVTMFYFISDLFGHAAAPYLTPYGADYFTFVLIGIAFSGYFSIGISSFSQKIRTAQTTGTLEAMLSTPTHYSAIIFASSLWDYLVTTVRVFVYIAVGVLLIGVSFTNANYFSALVILFLSIITYSSLGIIAASFIMVLKRGDPVTWLISSISSLLGGVYYPVAILPEGLRWLASLIPVTYSLHGMRLALLQGADISELSTEVLVLILFSSILLPLSLITFQYSVKRAKIDGSLTQY
jgi:ABC-2 type transport system permease protein